MVCERRNQTKCDNKTHCDLEEILHNHDQESLYMDMVMSSGEAMEDDR